jgi:type VI secretion system protein ImpG
MRLTTEPGRSHFTEQSGAPLDAVYCLEGPTTPRPAWAERDLAWRLISHLSLNYLSLRDSTEPPPTDMIAHPPQGASALRELLALYGNLGDASIRKQIEGVASVQSRAVTRRMPIPGPIAFGRGLEIALTCDETYFEGSGVFLLGAVLEEFFARYVSINTFTQTVVKTLDRGEIMRWPARVGRRHIL